MSLRDFLLSKGNVHINQNVRTSLRWSFQAYITFSDELRIDKSNYLDIGQDIFLALSPALDSALLHLSLLSDNQLLRSWYLNIVDCLFILAYM